MSVLFRYIFEMFLRHSFMFLLGLSAIFIIFDVLANASEITENSSNAFKTIWFYIGLRLPSVFILILPMVVLLSSMVTLHKLVKSQEMIAAGSAGFTIYKITGILLSGACLLAILQFIVSEYIATDTTARLRLWAEQNYTDVIPKAPEVEQKSWIASGNYIIHYEAATPNGHILFNPLFLRQTETGLIENYTRALVAFYENSQWILKNVYQNNFKEQDSNISISIDLNLHPDDLSIQTKTFEETKLSYLWGIISMRPELSEYTVTPHESLYELWLQRKLAQPLSVLLMVVLAAPMGLFIARRYNALLVSFGFIGAGFLYFITERILLSLGETATLPPFLAAWAPFLIFFTMSLWFMLHKQG